MEWRRKGIATQGIAVRVNPQLEGNFKGREDLRVGPVSWVGRGPNMHAVPGVTISANTSYAKAEKNNCQLAQNPSLRSSFIPAKFAGTSIVNLFRADGLLRKA
jgi:hypothetical protein